MVGITRSDQDGDKSLSTDLNSQLPKQADNSGSTHTSNRLWTYWTSGDGSFQNQPILGQYDTVGAQLTCSRAVVRSSTSIHLKLWWACPRSVTPSRFLEGSFHSVPSHRGDPWSKVTRGTDSVALSASTRRLTYTRNYDGSTEVGRVDHSYSVFMTLTGGETNKAGQDIRSPEFPASVA